MARTGALSSRRPRPWWFLAFFAVVLVIFGLTDIAAGATADPGIPQALTGKDPARLQAESADAYRMFDFSARTQGWSLALIGALLLAIVGIPYRAGERWAWWVAWAIPVWSLVTPVFYLAAGTAPGQPPAPPMVSGPILGVIGIVVLLLDRRRFVAR